MDKKQIEIQKKKIDIQLAVSVALANLGITSAEITYHQAHLRYGNWFREHVDNGDLPPCRIGKGATPTRWYSVSDILALKSIQLEDAERILTKK